ncbi:bifunctional 4-hydroxy-3-methylbut-2-enyl diphosphate reductase/30S ribosomal protein S1 [Enterocloster lavalensis]|uniref:4-hydroxy-3-methylbut-2-enyl diphosphate reductase n=3 Tax=Enterocloster lavalensis TaxID=460384 RepID=A0A1I0C994_9FIRM|nr:bifunctional 4-hydroxy-3-methylbut-2-enyl diphosphate reductase/30S ribosomal protein S1 [Enterocloster lavalensis]PST34201.1 bifunctional 4-hydroxy-3-methylbut-2-enyl diphosphate reductase/30S ribosomal protein S1 [Enterocloster lavalensis]SET15525.1 4-hydroxy-3-methylbut-2-enyl diphosphate reductase [Enterocloster lavalensis]
MSREVIVARTAGFCFGVERAVDQVYEQIGLVEQGKASGPIYTYGPIIHNEEVVGDLAKRGVTVLETEEDLKALPPGQGTVIIRSHGVSRHIYDILEERGVAVVDATCPFVKKIHRIVDEHSRAGEAVVIIGNASHPEVEGIRGWGNRDTKVVENEAEAEDFNLSEGQKLCIVSQTTFNYNKFKELVEKFSKKGYDSSVLNTICNATQERQVEAARIASQVEAMIVIGGRHSSNTQKLYEICLKECKNTFYIQTLGDLDPDSVSSVRSVGITAGASTPKKIIEEVHTRMAEQSFAELLKEEEESTKPIRTGEIVTGQVIEVSKDEIILSIAGNKSEGVITRDEYSNDNNVDLTTKVQVGDEMEAKVIKLNDGVGMVSLSYKRMAADRGNRRLEEAFENQEVLTAKVTQVLDGGLSVEVEGARVFIPASLVSDSYEKDLSKYAGQDIEFIITEFNPKRRRIIGDRKALLVAQKAKMKEELFSRIQPGDVTDGVVKNVTDFGAFIDLGGADGLLHISEMSWGRVENPKKVFKTGEQVRVLIKDIQGEKIALSLKFPEANPWVTAAERYAAGNIVVGRVARMTDFGAFIELEPGVDALLHVSQISREHVEKPSDVLRIGQEIEARVVDFNENDHKISLSIKALMGGGQERMEDSDVADVDINNY